MGDGAGKTRNYNHAGPPATELLPDDEETLIHVNDSEELRHWCRELNCTEQLLRDAVQRVGARLHEVKRPLGVR